MIVRIVLILFTLAFVTPAAFSKVPTGTVYFAKKSVVLGPDGRRRLVQLVLECEIAKGALPHGVDWRLRITGFSDSPAGPNALKQSLARSQAVALALEKMGISAEHLLIAGLKAESRSKSRQVDVFFEPQLPSQNQIPFRANTSPLNKKHIAVGLLAVVAIAFSALLIFSVTRR